MKSPLSAAPKSVRATSESIQRELAQLITHLEGTARSVQDARFRKIAMKSTEVLKGLRTLFERLGSEDQAGGAKRSEAAPRETKPLAKSSSPTGKEIPKKADRGSATSAKTNGAAPVATTSAKAPAPAAKPGATQATVRPGKSDLPPAAAAPAAPVKTDPLVAPVKPEDPAEIAAKARLQKQEARAPKRPGGHAAPKPLPPQSGKPIWNKPHSS